MPADCRVSYRESGIVPEVPIADNESLAVGVARHIAWARKVAALQRRQIERLRALGCDTRDAERTLQVFLGTLEIFEDRQRQLTRHH